MPGTSTRPNLRNFKEFRKELLAALGVNRSLVEVDDEEFKAGILEGLGITYEDQDLKNFERYRAKLIEGVDNYSGGGGSSDLSLCTANIVVGEQAECKLIAPMAYDSGGKAVAGSSSIASMETPNSREITVILYKGSAELKLDLNYSDSAIKSCTGNATMKSVKRAIITGDCTITIGKEVADI